MALGFLFLGGGTSSFGNSNEAVAALLLAVYPRLPSTPQDNRCHLQAGAPKISPAAANMCCTFEAGLCADPCCQARHRKPDATCRWAVWQAPKLLKRGAFDTNF